MHPGAEVLYQGHSAMSGDVSGYHNSVWDQKSAGI